MAKLKIIRTATIPSSLNILLKGQLSYLNQFYEVTAISGAGSDLDVVRNRESIRVIPVEMERRISVLKDLSALFKLYKIFKNENPEIVHSITPKAGLLSMLAAKFAKVPIRIHTFTGLIFPSKKGLMKWILILMDKLLCLSATNVYPEGEGVKKEMQKFFITDKPLKVIANGNVNGIDTAFFNSIYYSVEDKQRLKEILNINEKDFVFIFIGRLVKDKGINELITVFKSLKSDKCKLLLVGKFEKNLDPLLPEIERLIKVDPNIIAIGYKDDVRPYLAISDCLVFPSYREGFPNVVMQAGAMGLPSIVTNISGCNEIIIEGENGVVIAPKDKGALLNAMQLFLSNPQEVKRMAANARPLIVNRYEQITLWKALLDEYKKLEEEIKR